MKLFYLHIAFALLCLAYQCATSGTQNSEYVDLHSEHRSEMDQVHDQLDDIYGSLNQNQKSLEKLNQRLTVVEQAVDYHHSPDIDSFQLKAALQCAIPRLLDTEHAINTLETGNLSTSYEMETLTLHWHLPSADCYTHLTSLWVRIFEADDPHQNVSTHLIPKECLQLSDVKRLSLQFPSPSTVEPRCTLSLDQLVECRSYVVQVIPDFTTLKGELSQVRFIVPPKAMASALNITQSTVTSKSLKVDWGLSSEECAHLLTSVQLRIHRDTMSDDSNTVSMKLPRDCLRQDEKQFSLSLPATHCWQANVWNELDKCRRYRMTMTAEFNSRWTGVTSTWDSFTAETSSYLQIQMIETSLCPINHFGCIYNNWHYRCIPNEYVCNGNHDCYEQGEDENNCTYRTNCKGKFSCGRQCVSFDSLCNGRRDCSDGTDESDCSDSCQLLSTDSGSVSKNKSQVTSNSTYSISVSADLIIWLSFNQFTSYNPVKVFDGPYSTSPLLLNYSTAAVVSVENPNNNYYYEYYTTSTATPIVDGFKEQQMLPDSVQSSSNNLFLELPIGSLVNFSYTTVNLSDGYHSFSGGCGGYIRDAGIISLPLQGEECWWYVENLQSEPTLLLNNDKPDETRYSMTIYDGWNSGGLIINQQEASTANNTVYSLGNRISIRLTDSSSSTRTFKWTVSSIYTPECWSDVTGSSGTIHSPNYPGSYPPHADCRWSIRVESGSKIRLLFAFFDLEPNDDIIQVYDGLSVYSPSLLMASGKLPPLQAVSSSSNEMLVRLTTNRVTSHSGFLAIYSTVPCDAALTN